MVNTKIILLIVLLFFGVYTASAATNYQLAAVESVDELRIRDVTDMRILTAVDNVITEMRVGFVVKSDSTQRISVHTQGYDVYYNVTIDSTYVVLRTRTENLKTYRGGVLVDNLTDIHSVPFYELGMYHELQFNNGMVYGYNISSVLDILPNGIITVTSTSPASVYLTIYDQSEIYRIATQNELNSLFGFIYDKLTKVYDDKGGGLLNIFSLFSIMMDITVFVIWLTITNTYLLIVWIVGVLCFYAGWRNNGMKGFVDDMVSWHLGIGKVVLQVSKALFDTVYDIIKSIVPGLG